MIVLNQAKQITQDRAINIKIHKSRQSQDLKNSINHSWVRYICHQRPNRCFWVSGKPMPICARCFGVYLGLSIGIILPLLITGIYAINTKIMFFLMIVSLIPMALDGFTQLIGLRKSTNYFRFFTGLLAGIVLGIVFNWLIYHVFF